MTRYDVISYLPSEGVVLGEGSIAARSLREARLDWLTAVAPYREAAYRYPRDPAESELARRDIAALKGGA